MALLVRRQFHSGLNITLSVSLKSDPYPVSLRAVLRRLAALKGLAMVKSG